MARWVRSQSAAVRRRAPPAVASAVGGAATAASRVAVTAMGGRRFRWWRNLRVGRVRAGPGRARVRASPQQARPPVDDVADQLGPLVPEEQDEDEGQEHQEAAGAGSTRAASGPG